MYCKLYGEKKMTPFKQRDDQIKKWITEVQMEKKRKENEVQVHNRV